jgi:two-component system, OmpR family, response regulator
VFREVIEAGADMYLAKPVQFEQVALAIQAVQRRAVVAQQPMPPAPWKLDRRSRALLAPDGAEISLSETDVIVLEALMESGTTPVTRQALLERLGREATQEADETLNATIYRLRQRIKKATPVLVPLQTKSRVGYWFQAEMVRA